ncbi:hypothetical protein [Micromonospora sp. WMMD1082]|uniref:phage tail protein n=1 Tax=Micromonospora sp. WMMD1082 TaxID=3016104 RepID=UPI0024166CD7|nr:hypothetical protein [Micromonospora sp. WMMD1082]MDG4792703.1 hypothetical protein [Micromonospora sp. WMMD1082]
MSGLVFGRSFNDSADRSTRGGGLRAARNLVAGLGETLTSGVLSSFKMAFKWGPLIAIVAAAGAAAWAVLGATLHATLLAALGLGVIAAGVAASIRAPAVKRAWSGFVDDGKKALKQFAKPFEAPMIRAAGTFRKALGKIDLGALGKDSAPLVDGLAGSLADMVTGLVPRLTTAVKGLAPVIDGLDFGALGRGLGDMFVILAEGAPLAGRFLQGLFGGMERWLPALGRHLVSLTERFFRMVAVGRQIHAAVGPAIERVRATVARLFGAVEGSDALGRLRGYFDTLRAPLATLGETFRTVGGRFAKIWTTQLRPFFAELGERAAPMFREWGETIRSVLTDLSPIVDGASRVFDFLWTKLGIGSVVLGTIKSVFGGIVDVVTGNIRIIRGLFTLLAGIFTGDWSRMWDGLKTIASGAWKIIVGAFQILMIGRLGGLAKGLLGKLGGWFSGMFGKISGWALTWVNTLLARGLLLRSRLLSTVSGLVSRVVGFFTSMMSRGLSAWTAGAGRILGAARNLASRVTAPMRELVGRFRSIAGDVISGFINGIRAGAGRIISAVRSAITNSLPAYVKKALGIHSPSRVFMGLGRHVSEGMARGISQKAGAVTKAVAALARIPDASTVNVGTVTAAARGRSSGSPLIGQLTLAPSGESVRDQLDEVTWALRRIQRGGVYA